MEKDDKEEILNEILSIIRRWGLRYSEDDRRKMERYMGDDNKEKHSFLNPYLYHLRKLLVELEVNDGKDEMITGDFLSSGIVCFYGSILFEHVSMSGSIKEENIEILFSYASLYMVLDHYLDNPRIGTLDKIQFKGKIISLFHMIDKDQNMIKKEDDMMKILGCEKTFSFYRHMKVIVMRLRLILERRPNVIGYLKNVLEWEMIGMTVQRDLNHSRKTYLNVAIEKGGRTVQAIRHLFGDEKEENKEREDRNSFNLGASIQLVDDLIDLNDDRRDKINTIITHDFHGRILETILYICKYINLLPEDYYVFKFVLISGIAYAMLNPEIKIDGKIRDLIKEYCPIEIQGAQNLLNEVIRHQLFKKDN